MNFDRYLICPFLEFQSIEVQTSSIEQLYESERHQPQEEEKTSLFPSQRDSYPSKLHDFAFSSIIDPRDFYSIWEVYWTHCSQALFNNFRIGNMPEMVKLFFIFYFSIYEDVLDSHRVLQYFLPICSCSNVRDEKLYYLKHTCVYMSTSELFFELIILQNFLFELLCVCIWMDSFNNRAPHKRRSAPVYKWREFSTRNGTITFHSLAHTPTNSLLIRVLEN